MTAASGRSRTAQAPPNRPASVWARSSRPSTLTPLTARLRSSSSSHAAALERAWRSRLWSEMMGGRRGGRRLGTWAGRTSPPAGGSLAEPRPAPWRTERDAAALENKKPMSLWILASRLRSIPLYIHALRLPARPASLSTSPALNQRLHRAEQQHAGPHELLCADSYILDAVAATALGLPPPRPLFIIASGASTSGSTSSSECPGNRETSQLSISSGWYPNGPASPR